MNMIKSIRNRLARILLGKSAVIYDEHESLTVQERRKISEQILGDDTVLYISEADNKAIDELRYLDVPDETVGKMFKHFWVIASRFHAEEAEKESRGFTECMISGSVLYLASLANKKNGQSTTFAVSGSLDAGRTHGRWAVRIEKCPEEDVAGDPENPEYIYDPKDPTKLVSLSVSWKNPGYERWRDINAQRIQNVLNPEESGV